MKHLSIKRGEWVVVCDGAKALILENVGEPEAPNLKTREVHKQPDRPTHEQGTDEPGRTQSSVGKARSAVEQTDWHQRAEDAFLKDLAKKLDRAVTTGATKAIIIAAPPRALGVLREAFTPALRKAIRAEIDKDLVKMPVDEIEKHLAAA